MKNEVILKKYEELKALLESAEKDLHKNLMKKNTAAGRRVRAALRDLKKGSAELSRDLVALDKQNKEG